MSRNVYAKCQVQFLSFFFYGYSSQLTSLPVGRVLENMDDAGTAVRKTRGIRIDYRKLVDIQIPRSQCCKGASPNYFFQNNVIVTPPPPPPPPHKTSHLRYQAKLLVRRITVAFDLPLPLSAVIPLDELLLTCHYPCLP